VQTDFPRACAIPPLRSSACFFASSTVSKSAARPAGDFFAASGERIAMSQGGIMAGGSIALKSAVISADPNCTADFGARRA